MSTARTGLRAWRRRRLRTACMSVSSVTVPSCGDNRRSGERLRPAADELVWILNRALRAHAENWCICARYWPACGGTPSAPSDSPALSNPESRVPNPGSPVVQLTDDFGGRQLFPADNWWNQDISTAPVDPQSDAYINFIGRTRGAASRLRPAAVRHSVRRRRRQPGRACRSRSSTTAARAIPDSAARTAIRCPMRAKSQPNFIEGGAPGGGTDGDRHLLIVDRDRWVLYELFAARWNASRERWEAGSGAVFDLSSNARRPEGWTSADAAGLAILPGLVRYDEAMRGPIRHAFRVTVRQTNGYVWPASHRAGSTAGALPMGARLRLKASKDLSPLSGADPEHLPRDADLRPDRRRQRQRYVRHRCDGCAVEQLRSSTLHSASLTASGLRRHPTRLAMINSPNG